MSQASRFLFCGPDDILYWDAFLGFCAFMTVYIEPSAFPSINTQSSLQVQSTESSAPFQCAWLNVHRRRHLFFFFSPQEWSFFPLSPEGFFELSRHWGMALPCHGLRSTQSSLPLRGMLTSMGTPDRKGYPMAANVGKCADQDLTWSISFPIWGRPRRLATQSHIPLAWTAKQCYYKKYGE